MLNMDTQNQGLNTREGLWSHGMASDAQRYWLRCPTHQVPQLHWAWLLYPYITIHILTYLFFLAICAEGILQADGLKNQAQYEYRVKDFLFSKCSLSKKPRQRTEGNVIFFKFKFRVQSL